MRIRSDTTRSLKTKRILLIASFNNLRKRVGRGGRVHEHRIWNEQQRVSRSVRIYEHSPKTTRPLRNSKHILFIASFDNLGEGASGAAVECMNSAF